MSEIRWRERILCASAAPFWPTPIVVEGAPTSGQAALTINNAAFWQMLRVPCPGEVPGRGLIGRRFSSTQISWRSRRLTSLPVLPLGRNA
jgi:hypothetical protein